MAAISGSDWIDARYAEVTPAYWGDHFKDRKSGWSPPPRRMKSLYEHFHASAFSWWIETQYGLRTIFCLQDAYPRAQPSGGPDCEFHHVSGSFSLEMFALYFPTHKLELPARVDHLDRSIRGHLTSIPGEISISYESYLSVPKGKATRIRLAQSIGAELAAKLAVSGEVQLDTPIRLTAKKDRMPITFYGGIDDATPDRARLAFASQLEKHLGEAKRKRSSFDVERRCCLVITDHQTNAPTEAEAAFNELDPDIYREMGAVFWINASHPPFTLKALYERGSVFQ